MNLIDRQFYIYHGDRLSSSVEVTFKAINHRYIDSNGEIDTFLLVDVIRSQINVVLIAQNVFVSAWCLCDKRDPDGGWGGV